MASTWTTPATYAVGDVYTAATVNLYVRDNTSWLGTDKPMARVYSTTTQSVPNATPTDITFNAERFDNQNLHSSTSSTSKLIIPSGMAGTYLVGYTVALSAVGTAASGYLGLNGSSNIARDSIGGAAYGATATLYALTAADWIVAGVVQNSGGAANVLPEANNSPELFCIWMGT